MTRHRICGHRWTTNEGKPGSHHYCALDFGHLEPHECKGADGTCNEVLVTEAPPLYAASVRA